MSVLRLPKLAPARFQKNLQNIREAIAAPAYVALLHQGAMTGFLPRFDVTGKPTGEFDALNPHDRVDIARYLIDKILPDAPKELALVPPSNPEEDITAEVIRNLPTAELLALATTPTPTPTPEEAPAHGCSDAALPHPSSAPVPSPAGTSAA